MFQFTRIIELRKKNAFFTIFYIIIDKRILIASKQIVDSHYYLMAIILKG